MQISVKPELLITQLVGGIPVGYLHVVVDELNSRLPRTNRDNIRLEDLNQGPEDLKSSTLNYSVTLTPHSL